MKIDFFQLRESFECLTLQTRDFVVIKDEEFDRRRNVGSKVIRN